MFKKFDADTFLARSAGNFEPDQILGLLVANMHAHYVEQHKEVLRRVMGVYDNPLEVKRMIFEQLGDGNERASTTDEKDKDDNQLRLV